MFRRKTATAFSSPPPWGLAARYAFRLRVIGKRVLDLLVIIDFFAILAEALRANVHRVEGPSFVEDMTKTFWLIFFLDTVYIGNRRFRRGSLWSKISGRRGISTTILHVTKLG